MQQLCCKTLSSFRKLGLVIMTTFQLSILIVLITGCTHRDDPYLPPRKIVVNKEKSSITIQPFGDFPTHYIDYVVNRLKPIVDEIKIAAPVAFPQLAYYKPRNRYRADSLIDWLKKGTDRNHVILGITSKDISTTKGQHNDWGIMGLAYRPGKACVVSSFRLKNKRDELFKVAIHELAHTQGLPHCPIKSCYMRDAEGGNHTAQENGFCNDCKRHLIKKGWIL